LSKCERIVGERTGVSDLRNDGGRLLFDSGYTEMQIDRIFRSLPWGADVGPLEHYMSLLVIGLSDGDIDVVAKSGTVMLPAPRAEIEHRVGLVRSAIGNGATFLQAVCSLPGE
jgi:hypothetical protein